MQELQYHGLSSLVASMHLYNFIYLHKLNKNKTLFIKEKRSDP